MAKSKQTKKFEKKHLKDTIQRRKEFAKVKQKKQIQVKRKARRVEENGSTEKDENGQGKSKASSMGDKFNEMSVDDFFSGGFDMSAEQENNGKKAVSPVTGKRKRDSETRNGQEARIESETTSSDGESGPPTEDHKQQLEKLAKKDPEFYEYLKTNDAELLDFEGDGDIPSIEELASSEDEDVQESQEPQKKQRGNAPGNELAMSLVRKWQTAINEKKSLRSAKELVLAFRAAAHTNDETNTQYKYNLSNPEGE